MPTQRILFDFNRIHAMRQRLITESDLLAFIGVELSRDTLIDFLRCLIAQLPMPIELDLLRQTLLPMIAGRPLLTEDLLDEMCWHVSGNWHHLKLGIVMPPRPRLQEDEWHPIQILDVLPARPRKDAARMSMTLEFAGGTFCGSRIEITRSRSFGLVLHPYLVGEKSRRSHPYVHPMQMVNMRFIGLVETGSSARRLMISSMVTTGAIQNWNRTLYKMRMRRAVSLFACPMHYPDTKGCHRCHIGIDQCAAATHAHTYIAGNCPKCKAASWFSSAGQDLCVNCQNQKTTGFTHW